MTRQRCDWGYLFITGSLRAMEALRVTGAILDRMAKSRSTAEALEHLAATYYRDFLARLTGPGDYRSMLEARRKWFLDFIDAAAPDYGPGAFFRIGFDYHNIKVLLKEKIFETGRMTAMAGLGTIPETTMTALFESEGYSDLPECMADAVGAAVEAYYTSRDPLVIDCVADRFLFEDIRRRAMATGSSFIITHYRTLADLTNFHSFLRSRGIAGDSAALKELYVPGGFIEIDFFKKLSPGDIRALEDHARRYGYEGISRGIPEFENNPFAVEHEIENTLAEQLESARFLIGGIEPLFAFGKETELELSILGAILAGLDRGMKPEAIAGRLPSRFRSTG
ncbi:MAG: V-type ATPase subunit [Spirochaetes bacterium]|nr:V-type ATPase subunit [Spirochaetota bacterium]